MEESEISDGRTSSSSQIRLNILSSTNSLIESLSVSALDFFLRIVFVFDNGFLVAEAGLEPASPIGREILSLLCIPIPPLSLNQSKLKYFFLQP